MVECAEGRRTVAVIYSYPSRSVGNSVSATQCRQLAVPVNKNKLSADQRNPATDGISNYDRRQNGTRPAERVKGVEPSSIAWKAIALPLSYTREKSTPIALPNYAHIAVFLGPRTCLPSNLLAL